MTGNATRRRERRLPIALRTGLALLSLLPAACTPIEAPEAPGTEPPQLAAGDTLPDLEVHSPRSAPWRLGELAGGPVVITFLRGGVDAGTGITGGVVERLAEALRRLRPDVRVRTRVAVLLLDEPGEAAEPAPPLPPAWRVASGPVEELRALAGRFGVLLWDERDARGQTFLTVVLDPRLRIAARFPGTASWTAADLVGAIVAAAGE